MIWSLSAGIELSGVHYDDRYVGQGLDVTGGFYGYVPEQGIIVVALTLGDRSQYDGSAQESGLSSGINYLADFDFVFRRQ